MGHGNVAVVVVVRSLSRVRFFVTPWTAARQASLSFTIFWSLLKLMSIESVMPSNQSHPLSSPSPSALSLSQHQGLFQWVGSLHQVAKVLGFSFSIRLSNVYSGLVSFRIDWFVLLEVQRTLKSHLQQHNSKALFFSTQSYLWSNSHIRTWVLEKL